MSELPSRFGLNLPGHPVKKYIEMAQYADRLGVDSLWVIETRLDTDAVGPLAVYGSATDRIRLGSSVIPLWTRQPSLIAQSFATLDLLAPGRIILGMGAWWEPLASRLGVERRRPVRAMREVMESVRLLLARDASVTYNGDYVHLDNAYLDHQAQGPHKVKIYIAAVGPAMLRLAGRLADGVVFNRFYTVEAIQEAMKLLEDGARSAGRSIDQIDRVKLINAEVTNDKKNSIEMAKLGLAQYIAQQPHIQGPSGVDPDLVERIKDLISWPADKDAIRKGAKLIPDDFVDQVCCFGEADEVCSRLGEYKKVGVACPIIGGPTFKTIDALAEGF